MFLLERDYLANRVQNILVISCLSLSILFVSFSNTFAQISQLNKGDRVKISAPIIQPGSITGTVSLLSPTVVAVSVNDSLVYISESLISNVEISTGKKRVAERGLLIGAVTGAVVFGMISAAFNNTCSGAGIRPCVFNRRNGDAFVAGGTTGLIVGGIAGAVTGFFIRIDEWERVPVNVAMGINPVNTNRLQLEPKVAVRLSLQNSSNR